LLGYLAVQTDWAKFGAAFAGLRLELWFAAVGVLVVAQVVSALRWRALAEPLGFHRSARQMIGYYFIGMYFNLLLPTSVGGDVVRAWYLGSDPGSRLPAFVSVFLDRLSGLWVLLALACLGVVFSPLELKDWVVISVWGFAAAGALGSLLLPVLARVRVRNPGRFQRLVETLNALPAAHLLVWPTVLSIVVQVANVVLVWLVGMSLDARVPASYYWVLVPMVSLLTMLPISVNGMGVREGATAMLLLPLGVAQETAVTLALLWFAVTALVSLSGGVVYLSGRFQRPAHSRNLKEDQTSDGPFCRNPDQGRERQSQAVA
jgi:uncharacterized membrane protein YbhN (UPF0104 family)